MKNLVAIVGTNSNESTNRQLLQFMKQHFTKDANIEIIEIKDLPLFNKPDEVNLPDLVKEISNKIELSDGVIISTPEYDHSVPASLINALSWLSFHNHPFVDKPVMITGASYGTLGSSRAQMHLKQILDSPELKARTMPSSEFLLSHSLQAFDDNGNLKDEVQRKRLEALFQDFLVFTTISKKLNHAHGENKREAENFSWEGI